MRRVYNWFLPILALAFLVPGIHAQDIVARYDFSGKANDISIYANHAANHGAVLTEDRFSVANRAYWFDGVMSYLEADGFVPQLQSPTTTISFWVRVDELPAQGEVYLLSHGGWQERWKISLPSHGKPVFTTNHENGISDMDSGTPLEIGEWTLVTMVHDGLKDIIYFDGVQVAEKDVVGNLNTTFRRLGIGHDPIDGGGFFKGAIDEVTIWDGALDAAAVLAWYDAQAVNPVFSPGEVAHYPMNGNLLDVSPYMNHAVGTDVTFITNKFGFGKSAALFDGDSAKAVAANSAQLNSPETSVAFWIKANSLPGTGEYYVASHGGWQERWKISLPSHGKLVWTTNHTNGISDMDAGDAGALVAGEWAHAVFVHDGLKDIIYINGVQVAEKDVVGTLNDTEHPLGIGYNPIDGGNYFDGALDEFIIYNYALSAGDVSTLYATQNNPTIDPSPLVANFPFSGDYTDASQYHNDGEPRGSEFTQDRFGYANNAVYLNEAYVEVPNSEAYNSDYTTVSFWVNMKELPGTGEVYLMSYGGWQERWKISLPSHGKPVWTTNNSIGISDMDSGGDNALVPGEWTHVVFSHGPAQDKIYFDGVLVNSKNVGGTMNDTKYNLGIGWNQVDGGNFMNGDVDEVRIYNRDLTDQEVLDLYNEQRVEPVITDEVVANYPLNGNAVDISPYNNHGTVNGAVPFSDRFFRANHSMRFDGVSDYILARNSKQLNTPTTTVSFWVNVNTLPANGEAYLLSFGGWQERWKISLPTHGKVVWTTNNTSGISDMDAGDGNALVPGTWMHVAMVHDGTNDCIYINGVMANCKAVAGDLNNTAHNLGFGFNPIDGGSYFDGSLDDVMIFNRGLNAGEVLALYNAQNNPPLVTDATPPCPPENLKAEVVFTTVTLSWTASTDDNSGVSGYNVFLNNALVATTTETTWTFAGLAPLTSYEVGVSAVDSAGNQSTVTSMTVTTGMEETPDTEAPSTPANLVVSPGANSAVFSWDPSIDNVAVAGYVVSVDGNFVDTLAANETSIFIGGLDPETLYAFEVYAFDFAGNNSEVAFIVASTTEPIVTAEPGLVAHYKFEGNANDSTPYNNHGSIGGNPVFEPSTHAHGSGMNIDFDGDQDSVLVPNAVQLISDYTTVSFWVRPDDQNLADAESYILDFGHWDERWKISLPQHLKVVWTTNSHNAQFDHFISDMDSGDGNELVLGFWWYVTMVHDGTDDIIYLDGVEVNRKPVDGELNATARPLGMGNNPIDGGQYFIGGLDEVKIYNKALTSAEIAQLYATGTTGLEDLQQIGKYVEIIYPNPTVDDVVIKHSFAANQDLVIRIYDQAGRQIGSNRFDANALGDGTLSMNVSDLESGIYNLNFVLGGKNLGSVPFVKQ